MSDTRQPLFLQKIAADIFWRFMRSRWREIFSGHIAIFTFAYDNVCCFPRTAHKSHYNASHQKEVSSVRESLAQTASLATRQHCSARHVGTCNLLSSKLRSELADEVIPMGICISFCFGRAT